MNDLDTYWCINSNMKEIFKNSLNSTKNLINTNIFINIFGKNLY